jgi:hypothetical protein
MYIHTHTHYIYIYRNGNWYGREGGLKWECPRKWIVCKSRDGYACIYVYKHNGHYAHTHVEYFTESQRWSIWDPLQYVRFLVTATGSEWIVRTHTYSYLPSMMNLIYTDKLTFSLNIFFLFYFFFYFQNNRAVF